MLYDAIELNESLALRAPSSVKKKDTPAVALSQHQENELSEQKRYHERERERGD